MGDVAEAVWEVAGQVSPVPGGVGALTTSFLLEHTIAACERPTAERPAIEGAALARILGPVASELSPELADRLAGLLNRHLVTGDLSDRRSALERRLQRGVVIMDGAMGSELIAAGVAPAAVAAANLDAPDLVAATHRRYVDAGAEVLLTNTFTLDRYRVPDRQRCLALIQAGVRQARQAASGQVLVLGSIGPLPGIIDADLPRAEAVEAFAEIALAMADAGVDGFCCETMPSTAHAAAALAGVRRVSALPVVVSRAYPADDAAELQEFAEAMAVGGALAVGLNCVGGPSALLPAVRELAARSSLPVLARPNAGSPRLVGGRPHYQLRPEWMARQAEAYRQAGVALIGGCCGVGPEHIAAVAARCAGQPRVAPASPALVAPAALASRPAAGPGPETDFTTIALLPGGLAPQAMLAAGAALADAGLDGLGIDPSWPGSPAPADLPSRLRHLGDAVDRPLVCSLSAGSVTVRQAEAVLWSAHLLGIDRVLVDCGSFCAAVADGGIAGEELVHLIERMNQGRDAAGNRLPEPTRLRAIVRLSAEELAGAQRWRALGVDAISLQPVYAPRRFRAAIERYDADLPLLAEVLVLPDAPTAEALDNEVPALQVPRRLIDRLAEDPAEDQRGVLRFLAAWRERLAGVCLILPDARTGAAVAVLQGLRGASSTTL